MEEEKAYLERYRNGDLKAKDVLIERNLRLVAHVVRKYQTAEEDTDDLISIGTIGLIKQCLRLMETGIPDWGLMLPDALKIQYTHRGIFGAHSSKVPFCVQGKDWILSGKYDILNEE